MRRTRTFLISVLAAMAVVGSILPALWPAPMRAQAGGTTGFYSVPATACQSTVPANTATGTQGFTVVSGYPVVAASTTNASTNNHIYQCDITPPTRLQNGVGVRITAATFYYGCCGSGNLGTQVSVLADGTMNGTIVFGKVLFNTPAASESGSTVTLVRADSGTLTITPVVASFNVTSTGTGVFYSVKFTAATPFQLADNTKYYLHVNLLNSATTTTITSTPGAIVYTQ